MKDHSIGGYNVALAHGAKLINAKGERFMAKYDPVRFERSELNRVVAAFVKEIIDGRGPVFLDFRDCDESYFSGVSKVRTALDSRILLSGKVPDPRKFPLPIEPTWGLWNGTRSGIDNDREGRSNVPGLLSAGSCSKNYATGTHGSAGVPTAFCMTTGYVAGETAAREAQHMQMMETPRARVEELCEKMFEPLGRRGAGGVDEIHDALSMMETDVVETIVLDASKLRRFRDAAQGALARAEAARAADPHDLVKLREARNLAQACDLVYASALDRTESREQFYRSDFPLTDDENWFVWHGVTRAAEGGMAFDRAKIPLGQRFEPPLREKHPSAIAAIMAGDYDHRVYDEAAQ
jgi:succinate dehydrogenase/fumarate reductase flavoprotein subunit